MESACGPLKAADKLFALVIGGATLIVFGAVVLALILIAVSVMDR